MAQRLDRIRQHLCLKPEPSNRTLGLIKTGTTSTAANTQPFHLAFPVHNLEAARHFYCNILGCTEGRSSRRWIDFSLYGNQITCQLVGEGYKPTLYRNSVDEDEVPFPHFGIVLTVNKFHEMKERLQKYDTKFVISPHRRFKGEPGDQWTMFFKDPSGNCLEFKAMVNKDNLFASYFVEE